MPLLPLWAIRPVQSLSACTRVRLEELIVHESAANNLDVLHIILQFVDGNTTVGC